MSYYRTCPSCGAHLDPGEVCDCHRLKSEIIGKDTALPMDTQTRLWNEIKAEAAIK